jgi:hypothetical protein
MSNLRNLYVKLVILLSKLRLYFMPDGQVKDLIIWIEALHPDRGFKKGRGMLHDPRTDGYCCLGVACVVHDIPIKADSDFTYKEVCEKLGFNTAQGNLGYPIDPENRFTHPNLARLNDSFFDGDDHRLMYDHLIKNIHLYVQEDVANQVKSHFKKP